MLVQTLSVLARVCIPNLLAFAAEVFGEEVVEKPSFSSRNRLQVFDDEGLRTLSFGSYKKEVFTGDIDVCV